jgi:Ca-activated chloride channel family protein
MVHFRRVPSMAALIVAGAVTLQGQQDRTAPDRQDQYRFKSGVELVNVTATVTDRSGRFVPNLAQDDFTVYEDDVRQEIAYFNAERVPVSLGIVLDTSGSMAGEKIEAARAALNRFLYDLLDARDEIFLYRFNDDAIRLQGWTTDRDVLTRALGRITPSGGTALYDAVAAAIPMASRGTNRKKALLVISDGNDTSSARDVGSVTAQIKAAEVIVYAIGIDSNAVEEMVLPPRRPRQPRFPMPPRFPPRPGMPGRPGRPGGRFPGFLPQIVGIPGGGWQGGYRGDDRVNVDALRQLTDDSGGRTEVVRDARDLDPATASIADELSKQYALGYTSDQRKDGRWHAIRVEVRDGDYVVRARRGYYAN